MFGLPPLSGMRMSKFSLLLASLAASGVFAAVGVRDQGPCPGLGVTLTKSAKLKPAHGVLRSKPRKARPPGVDIMDEGSGVCFVGRVEGGNIGVLVTRIAGDGEAARKRRRSAPSFPPFVWEDWGELSKALLRRRAERARSGGGVRGGEEDIWGSEDSWKEWSGRSWSSSSDMLEVSIMVDVSDAKDGAMEG